MIIKTVKVSNFRSHEQFLLDCKKKVTQILGENGCGKTSILEAIYIVLQGKSFRATDREIVKRGTDFYRIEIEFFDGRKIIVVYEEKNGKTFLIEDQKKKRLPKKNKYPVILFEPKDLNLVGSSPTRKRDFFDRMIQQWSEKYHDSLLRYQKALKQRNELLKKDGVTAAEFFSWNLLLAKYGVEIREMRNKMVDEINSKLTKVYREIAQNNDDILLNYESYTKDFGESEYLKILEMNFEKDLFMGHTSFGVHKDDYDFMFNEVLADGNASRGEVRSIMVAMKFIEADILEKKVKKKPLILLDDVFSELDETRQKALVKNFEDNQIILTSVEGV